MKYLWFIAVPVAAAAVSPIYTNPLADQNFQKGAVLTNQFFEQEGLPAIVQTIDQESSYFGQRYTQRVSILAGEDQSQPLCIDLVTDMSVNPIQLVTGNFANSTTSIAPLDKQDPECGFQNVLELDPQVAEFYRSNFGENSPIEITANYGINGSTSGEYLIRGVNADASSNSAGVAIQVSDFNGVYTTNDSLSEIVYSGSWPGFKLNMPDQGIITIGEVALSGDQYLSETGNIWLGTGDLTASDFSISGAQNVSYRNMFLGSTSDLNDGLLDASVTFGWNDMAIESQEVGSLDVDIAATGLKQKELEEITKIFEDMQLKQEQGLDVSEQAAALNPLLRSLIETAKIKINKFRFYQDDSEATISGDLKLSDADTLPLSEVMLQPIAVLSHVSANLEAALDRSLVKLAASKFANISAAGADEAMITAQAEMISQQWEMMLNAFVDQGILTISEKDDAYAAKVNMEKGELTVNGTPMNLPL